MKCAITGAGGYVGSALTRYFRERGWEVVALGRRPVTEADEHIRYDLQSDPKDICWVGVDALIHCAYDFSLTKWDEIKQINVEGSIQLLRSASEAGVSRGVFISSLSCFEGCKSLYGKAKLLIEAEALALGFNVVRPGLVWGGDSGGTMGSLVGAAEKGGLIPLIGDGSYPQYLIHEEDLAKLCFDLCQDSVSPVGRAISAANAKPVSLKELLRGAAEAQGNTPRFVSVPWQLILVGLRTLEILHLPTPFRSDSLIGIVFQDPSPDFNCPELSNPVFREFRS
ncbi:MAG: NAD(P)-dependent oxidoreductase [Verrucomicrobia bacterium]|nr:NAD(P)-dependent oxidoreductase [Verrucomicrobiota bacterium]